MEALDRDKNGSISFEELWDWWVGYCMKAGTLHGTGLSPPETKEWELYQGKTGKTGLAAEQQDVVDIESALQYLKHEKREEREIFMKTSPRQLIAAARCKPSSPAKTSRALSPLTMPTAPPGSSPRQSNFNMRRFDKDQPRRTVEFANMPQTSRTSMGATSRLNPLMKVQPHTHRGPTTHSSGYRA